MKKAVTKKAATRKSPAKKSAVSKSVETVADAGSRQRRRSRLPTAEQIRSGLEIERLNELGRVLQISDDQLSLVVRVPRATLNRRRVSGQLTHEEGDRTAIVMRVFAQAVDYFEGDEDAARRWMKHPAPAFDGETPLKRCDTATGAQEVITLLTRLEHGIPA